MSKEDETKRDPRISLSPPPLATFQVVVEAGPERGRSIEILGNEPSEIIVGQSPVCALQLTDALVSRRHAAFDVVGDRLRVRDLESKNGTFVGSVRVVLAFAAAGDSVSVGRTTLRVAQHGPAAAALPQKDHFGDVLGISREMRRLFPLLERLAASSIPVLIEGDTGTGKEAVAHALHASGPRADKPFVLFDCTALAPNLVESELFGHEKGAFTGAGALRRGVFEQAHEGTLFIDELGELSMDLQAKLLRAIESGQVRRLGGDRWIQCDVRLVVATRRSLDGMVQDGRFRDDLFHRIVVGRVALPPLKERRGDVPMLVEHFCAQHGQPLSAIPREVFDAWCASAWPGNIRELRNAVSRELALGDLARLPAESVESQADASPGAAIEALLDALLPYDEARQKMVDLFQRAYVERMLRATGGNVQRAAEVAGIALRYFQLLRARFRRDAGS